MLRNRRLLPAILLLCSFPHLIFSQDITDIIKSFNQKDALLLSTYFAEQVTINVEGKESSFTIEDALREMEDFFRVEEVNYFSIIFQGEKENSSFIIGRLQTGKKTYRVNIFFRNIQGKNKINLLRIESENDIGF